MDCPKICLSSVVCFRYTQHLDQRFYAEKTEEGCIYNMYTIKVIRATTAKMAKQETTSLLLCLLGKQHITINMIMLLWARKQGKQRAREIEKTKNKDKEYRRERESVSVCACVCGWHICSGTLTYLGKIVWPRRGPFNIIMLIEPMKNMHVCTNSHSYEHEAYPPSKLK